jgi:hypothetical protein
MRKILKSACIALFTLGLPGSLVFGQDLKSEQKIKIVVDEGSGKKVVIDTVFKNSPMPDSLILKDGTVILIKHPGEEPGLKQHKKGDVYFYSNSDSEDNKEGTSNRSYHVITRKSHDNGDKSETIYIKSYNSSADPEDKTFDVYVSDDDKDLNADKSRYVIAKDGVVITVEGSDEAKTQGLVREIETLMGVSKDDSGKKVTVKTETKKTLKK